MLASRGSPSAGHGSLAGGLASCTPMSDQMKAIFVVLLGRAPPNKTSKLLRHKSEAPGAVTGHCDTFSRTLEGLCPRGPPSGSLQSVRGDAAMQNKYAEVTPRNFSLGWPEQIVDTTRAQMQSITKMQIQTMDQM